jgi:hypothetical protein
MQDVPLDDKLWDGNGFTKSRQRSLTYENLANNFASALIP